jgi:hypothetical protein
MDNIENRHGSLQEAVTYNKALRKRQRRFQIEILIAACFICLLAGFVAGASWHYMKVRGEKAVIVVEPATEPVEEPEKGRTRA